MPESITSIKPGDRAKVVNANRQAKMAESAHAYVRGNTLQFYEWLNKHSARSIPEGPPIWICGDCMRQLNGDIANLKTSLRLEGVIRVLRRITPELPV